MVNFLDNFPPFSIRLRSRPVFGVGHRRCFRRGVLASSSAAKVNPYRNFGKWKRLSKAVFKIPGIPVVKEGGIVHKYHERRRMDAHLGAVEELGSLAAPLFRRLPLPGGLQDPVHLGRGHPNKIGAPLDLQLRREQMRLLARDRDLIRRERRELTKLVLEAWRQFRGAV